MTKKAYSYQRFSSKAQATGDSIRRQTELARKWVAGKNSDPNNEPIELDDSFRLTDKGVSSFRGKNVTEGRLSRFLEAVEAGKVPKGSYLLVENFDRLSRDKVFIALNLLNDILQRGITVVTLQDNQEFTADSLNNQAQLMYSIMAMSRAHEESHLKSVRVREAWSEKKRLARSDKLPSSSKTPGWIVLNKKSRTFELHPERSAIVRTIFEMSSDGLGKQQIARILNQEGVETFGRSKLWYASYVHKILQNRAVLGEFQQLRTEHDENGKIKVLQDGDPISGYFPPAIDEALWFQAQHSIERRRGTRTRGRRGGNQSNLFQGLCKCKCGASMTYVNKGQRPKGGQYLQCMNARSGKPCDNPRHNYHYATIEEVILGSLLHWQPFHFQNSADVEAQRGRVAELESRLMATKSESKNLIALASKSLDEDTRDMIADQLALKGAEAVSLQGELADTLKLIDRMTDSHPFTIMEVYWENLNEWREEGNRPLTNARLLKILEQISFDADQLLIKAHSGQHYSIRLGERTGEAEALSHDGLTILSWRWSPELERVIPVVPGGDLNYQRELLAEFSSNGAGS